MEPPDQFQALMQEVRAGSSDALKKLVDEYGEQLRAVIRHKLNRQLRAQFDSQDFMQDTWASFVRILPYDFQFETPEQLCAWLRGVAANKVVEAFRQVQTQKNNAHRVISLDDPTGLPATERPGTQPTPSRVLMAREELNRRLEGMPELYQRIVLLLGTGHTQDEIAHEVKLNIRTVQRLIQKIAPGFSS